MHRRVPLDYFAKYLWHGISLRIDTNSRTLLQAASDAGLNPSQDVNGLSEFCWEFNVEEDAVARGPAGAPHFWRNGHSVYIEIAQRQWFAFDVDSGDGTGFLAAPAADLVALAYLEAILRILEPELRHNSDAAGCNG
jgi:hypothetical protein